VKDLACAPDETFPSFQVIHKGSTANQQALNRERAVIDSAISSSLCNLGKQQYRPKNMAANHEKLMKTDNNSQESY
jgi:hypothetical protein